MRKRSLILVIDLVLVFLSFLFFAWIKPGTKVVILPNYWLPFLYFLLIWLAISIFLGKFRMDKVKDSKDVIVPILINNFTILSVISIIIYSFQFQFFSRSIVFGTIALATVLEMILGMVYYAFARPVRIAEDRDVHMNGHVVQAQQAQKVELKEILVKKQLDDKAYQRIRDLITEEAGSSVFDFIDKSINLRDPRHLILSTTTRFNILNQPEEFYHNIINLKRINDIRYINKFFESVNNKLEYGGMFIDFAETYVLRKRRILHRYWIPFNYIIYFLDWVWKRFLPKMPLLKKVYFFLTKGRNRVISKAETFGRLYSCGFEIKEERLIEGSLYFCARKIKEPAYDYNPTYGPVITLKRYGKGGKLFNVYKLRTMHAYSEYLQDYIYDKYNLAEGGKFNNDFRVTTLGKFLRKFWLDELPMMVNVFRGDMKIVGVRPLSRHYFNLYDEEVRKKRIKFKPGLIPPYYADMPNTLEEIMESEMKYLNACEKHPFITDIRYFFLALKNIIFNRARSK